MTVFVLILVIGVTFVDARERILSFNSDITVHKDGTLTIVETIKVLVKGDVIKHGIVREFPTQYKNKFGITHGVPFQVHGVSLDGFYEPYFIKYASNGQQVFIGSKDAYVSRGEHEYRIKYTTGFQLGFFENHDELYWNVTGNGWRFPINKATALVHLPKEIPLSAVHVEAYTGAQGARERNYTTEIVGDAIYFEAGPFSTYNGLTILVTWKKGLIRAPTAVQKIIRFIQYNYGILCMILCFLGVLIFYIITYVRIRQLDRPGIIVPLYKPPYDLTPGTMRYIFRMGYDTKVLVSELVNMAVKGAVVIEYAAGVYMLKKTSKTIRYYSTESILRDKLFIQMSTIALSSYNPVLKKANDALREHIDDDARNHPYFDYHLSRWCIGVILLIVSLVLGFVQGLKVPLYCGIFVFGAMAIMFSYLFRRYTPEGRKIKDAIDGFKMFLSATETERLRVLSYPQEAVREYERYLPYAIALGVEKNWTNQFAPIFDQLARTGHAYVPIWYHGDYFDASDMSSFISDMGESLSSAISSSSTAPGESSGSDGGGSSGGGGGGGGGGGW